MRCEEAVDGSIWGGQEAVAESPEWQGFCISKCVRYEYTFGARCSAMKLHTDPNSVTHSTVSPGRLLDVHQVADVLGCGRTLVYELLGRGELRHMKIGRLTRVPSSEVDRYVRRQMGVEDGEAVMQPAPRLSRRASPGPTLPF